MSDLNQGTWAENRNQGVGVGTGSENALGVWVENSNSTAGAGMGNTWQQNTAGGAQVSAFEKKETGETKMFRENYCFFAPAAFIYAVFYAFCMYKNGSGITFPFFVGGGLLFLCLSLQKLGITLKKGSIFYMAAMMLLGISTFCTDDSRIIDYNKLGIFLLMMSLLLKQFYDTSKWKLGKFLGSIFVMVFACFGELGRPFSDRKVYRKNHPDKDGKKFWAVIVGMIAAVPLLLVVLLLLSSADAVFRQITWKLWDNFGFLDVMNIMFRIIFIFFASYTLLSYLCGKSLKEGTKDRRTGEPVMAITVTGLLTLLYLFFSGIQIAGLFLRKLKLPEDYTYAMYAREGFFQLLLVGLINLVIVLVCIGFFRESFVLKVILTLMSLCTFVMIASSAMRVIIYIHYYYMTFDRLLAMWSLALLAFLFIGIVINIFKEGFPLFRYSMVVVTVLYLLLSFSRPDYIIAKVNVGNIAGREAATEMNTDRRAYSDYVFLSRLSADAAPVIVPYLQELGYNMEAYSAENPVHYMRSFDEAGSDKYHDDTKEGFGYYWMWRMRDKFESLNIRTFNVSRYIALRKLQAAAGK